MADQWGTILTAVESALAAVSELSGIPVERRERVTFDAERDTLPRVLIAQEKRAVRQGLFSGTVFYGYPIVVAYLSPADLSPADSASQITYRAVLEGITRALYVVTFFGTTVWDCDYDPDPVVSIEGLDRMLRVGAQRFTYVAREGRN